MRVSEKFDQLDRVFDLLLVLLSIITASLFEYHVTTEPLRIASLNLTETEYFQMVNSEVLRGLRMLFIPLILLILFWMVNRIFLKERFFLRKTLSEFCYLFAFSLILLHISIFFGVSFHPFSFEHLSLIVDVFFYPLFLLSFCIVYYYEILFINRRTIKTRIDAVWRMWMPIFLRTSAIWLITTYLVVVINEIVVHFN